MLLSILRHYSVSESGNVVKWFLALFTIRILDLDEFCFLIFTEL